MTPPNCCQKSKGSHYKLVDSNSPIAILKMKPLEKIFWKTCRDNVVVIPDENQEDDADANNFWLRNDLYNLRFDDQKILRSPTAWLNGRIMDAARRNLSARSWDFNTSQYSTFRKADVHHSTLCTTSTFNYYMMELNIDFSLSVPADENLRYYYYYYYY